MQIYIQLFINQWQRAGVFPFTPRSAHHTFLITSYVIRAENILAKHIERPISCIYGRPAIRKAWNALGETVNGIDPIHESLERHGKKLPFGDPDGARAALENSEDFIPLDSRIFSSGVTISGDDRNIRVIVGKKGAGKTLYLRRLQDSARRESSVFASKIARDIPSTNSVVEFCQSFAEEKVTEAWQAAWRIAILNSAYSHIVTKKVFSAYLDQDELRKKYNEIVNPDKSIFVERNPYSELKDIMHKYRSERNFWQFANDSRWDDLQTILGTFLKDCPPLFIYLDASDDEFAHAPMDWHRCQKGLFYAVMRMLSQSGAISSRLHAVIVIRDLVYSSVLLSEHRTRYINSSSICLLDWNYQAIKYFFNKKISNLSSDTSDIFENPKKKDYKSFLGIGSIINETRNISESADDYLLRHTRSIPRDVVQVCNAIALEKIELGKSRQDPHFWSQRLRKIISELAATFAEEQIQICANQLSSHEAPSRSAQQHYAELYTSDKEYIQSRGTIIKAFISKIGRETFTYDEMKDAEDLMRDDVPPGVSLSTILWQNGLIGIQRKINENNFSFFTLKSHAGFQIPTTADVLP